MKFNEDGSIHIRQSWLDGANRCPESGRLSALSNERTASDATALGTGAHAGAEYVLHGHADRTGAIQAIAAAIDEEINLPSMKWNKYDGRADILSRAIACFDTWQRDIYPNLPHPGVPEVDFKVPLFTTQGRAVYLTGTIDYVPIDEPVLYDWKFPGRKYNQKEKQKWAVQPTAYSMAAILGGLSHVTDQQYTWPMTFVYATAITQKNDAKPFTFEVTRTQQHAEFLKDRVRNWVDLALDFGMDMVWPRNDEHYLCSDLWCDGWDQCKGQYLSWKEDHIPVELVKK